MAIMSFAHLKKTASPSTGKKDENKPLIDEGNDNLDMVEMDLVKIVTLIAEMEFNELFRSPDMVEECWKGMFKHNISQGNIPACLECLEKLAEVSAVSPVMITMLKGLIGTDTRSRTSGPKKGNNLERDLKISRQYRYLCENLSFATLVCFADRKTFEVVGGEAYNFLNEHWLNLNTHFDLSVFFDDSKPPPIWKYPDSETNRNTQKIQREDIKWYLCNSYRISMRTLHKILKAYMNHEILGEFHTMYNFSNSTYIEARIFICKHYRITKGEFDQLIDSSYMRGWGR